MVPGLVETVARLLDVGDDGEDLGEVGLEIPVNVQVLRIENLITRKMWIYLGTTSGW